MSHKLFDVEFTDAFGQLTRRVVEADDFNVVGPTAVLFTKDSKPTAYFFNVNSVGEKE